MWEDKLSECQIRGWNAVSAEGLQGQGSCESSVFVHRHRYWCSQLPRSGVGRLLLLTFALLIFILLLILLLLLLLLLLRLVLHTFLQLFRIGVLLVLCYYNTISIIIYSGVGCQQLRVAP